MDRELTPKQQTSEAVRQAEHILIVAGQHPTADQVASVIALGMVLRKFGKKVSTVISDDVPSNVRFLVQDNVDRKLGGQRDFIMRVDLSNAEVDKIKYTLEDGKLNVHVTPFSGSFTPQDVSYGYGNFQFDIVIALGVAAYSRMDRAYTQDAAQFSNVPLINIDFHRSNEQYGAVNLIDGNAASLGEILVALSESLQTGLIDAEIATVFLAGIMAATDRFTATHTTSKALTVAAQMMAAGADQQKVVRGLYKARDQRTDSRPAPTRTDQPRTDSRPLGKPSNPAPQPQATVTVLPAPPPQSAPVTPAQPAPVAPATPEPQQSSPPSPQVGKTIIAGGKIQGTMAPRTAEPSPAPQEAAIDELLPPQHIEMSEYEYQGEEAAEVPPVQTTLSDSPEPLFNYEEPKKPEQMAEKPADKPKKSTNPANVAYFTQG